MKWLTICCGLLVGWGMLLTGSAMAELGCTLETKLTSSVEAVETVPPAASTETVVIISGSNESVGAEVVMIKGNRPAGTPGTPTAGSEVVVKGGPSQSVRVIAPSNVTVTAIGGDGQPGTPGTPGN